MLNQNFSANFQSFMEALEDRVLFDGVPDAAVIMPAEPVSTEAPPAISQPLNQADVDLPHELILVDAGVENREALLASIIEENPNSGLEIRFLDADSDGIDQISKILSESTQRYDAIHILSHGSDGQIQLGDTQLNDSNISRYVDQISGWSDSLTEDADLLIYGCNLAETSEGQTFVQTMAAVTGADVAASDDLTGHESLGGDWDLEYATGEIETDIAITSRAQIEFIGVLNAVSGVVFEDVNNDGTNNGETGIDGVSVTAFDSTGVVVDTAVTSGGGNYSLNNPSNGALRLEFNDFPADFGASTADSTADANTVSSVAFLEASTGNVTANLGLHRAIDGAEFVTTCYVFGGLDGNSEAAVLHFEAADGVTETIATIAQVGTTNGLAVHEASGDIFSAAFQKRHSDIGPEGNGAIYRIDAAGNVSTFVDLDDFFGADAAGVYSHGDATAGDSETNRSSIAWENDLDAFDTVGKVAWGDLEISDDGQTLYAVNLFDRSLYAFDIGDSSDPNVPADYAAGDSRTIQRYDILGDALANPTNGGIPLDQLGLNPDANIRPFALEYHNGKVYVGMVNSAQFDAAGDPDNNTAADLQAYVFEFDPATGAFSSTASAAFDLDYLRGNTTFPDSANSANWRPWTDDFNDLDTAGIDAGANSIIGAQPWLTDIEFDTNGDLLLGFRDRVSDQIGWQNGAPVEDGETYSAFSAGDLLRATDNGDGTFEIEPLSDIVIQETYNQDTFRGHEETFQGGIALVEGSNYVFSTVMDATDIRTGGYHGVDTATGEVDYANDIYSQQDSNDGITFGKASGLGDVEYTNNLEIEIGNRVWLDVDTDGIQDAGEQSLLAVEVGLYDTSDPGNPVLVGTTFTDSNGEYYFNDSNVTYPDGSTGLRPLTDYEIRLEASNFTFLNPLDSYSVTSQNQEAVLVPTTTETVSGAAEFDTTGDGNFDTARSQRIEVLSDNGLEADGRKVVLSNVTGGSARVDADGSVIFDFADGSTSGSFDYEIFEDRLDNDAVGLDTNGDGVEDLAVIQYTTGADGSVDHSLDFGVAEIDVDRGDLPDVYRTSAGRLGPAHILDGVTFLGSSVDADTNGFPSNDALGDDTDGTDDEDGVTFDTPINPEQPANISVTASTDGFLNAWIDFNSSGNLDEVTVTHVNGTLLASPTNIDDLALNAGETVLTIDVPLDARGEMAARFRFTADPMGDQRSTTGLAATGEVEDYVLGAIGNFTFVDANEDGIQGGTESPLSGVVVNLLDGFGSPVRDAIGDPITTTTDAFGRYQFPGLPDGDYQVEFIEPAGFQLTEQNSTVDENDSDPDPATGITRTYTISAGVTNNTVDAGFIEDAVVPPVLASLGDRVFFDANGDGVFDDAVESGVQGVVVNLLDGTGAAVSDGAGGFVTTSTDVNGFYQFNDLTPGNSYQVDSLLPRGKNSRHETPELMIQSTATSIQRQVVLKS